MDAKKFSTKQLVEMALLTAVIILLAFTPLGYIRTLRPWCDYFAKNG